MTFDCVVVGSHLRIDGVRQRPQQLLARLALRVPVLIVEEPFLAAEDRNEFVEHGGLSALRPLRRSLAGERIDALALADAFANAPLVYDCMDELAAFAFAPLPLREREGALLARADLVFAGGRSLYEARRALGEKVRLYPSGVDFEHFAQVRALSPHALFAYLARPVYGYVGVIDERLDLDVLAALAASEANVVLVGPIVKIDPAVLPRRPNVHFTGPIEYAQLPSLLAGFDVALMPFARNAATANISPTKTPEYLAAAKPVVSTRVPDVLADWGDVVAFADTPAEFVATCARAAAAPPAERIARGVERARSLGWDALLARMWADLIALSPLR